MTTFARDASRVDALILDDMHKRGLKCTSVPRGVISVERKWALRDLRLLVNQLLCLITFPLWSFSVLSSPPSSLKHCHYKYKMLGKQLCLMISFGDCSL